MTSVATRPVQVIEGKDIDARKLIGLLSDVYGQDNFRVELRLNRYRIYPATDTADGLTPVGVLNEAELRRKKS
ncbi:uncharacterized protein BKCO1_970006 [Diplodia corticola]|uniref:Uncharacterized protein n=1 Tax=Diplodia corticola TaxID=236234 RepID=A0A1J9RKI2_9PEZI|nr:uncharacterized protein BKCO1_970006 [Diplodia corticola]OJD29031.1 hypothetical protein BKCO1_970006 [Diplodia corticola]